MTACSSDVINRVTRLRIERDSEQCSIYDDWRSSDGNDKAARWQRRRTLYRLHEKAQTDRCPSIDKTPRGRVYYPDE